MAATKLQRCQFSSAIYWLLLAGGETSRVTQVASKVLDNFLAKGARSLGFRPRSLTAPPGETFGIEDIMQRLASDLPFPDKLAFLNQYHQLHQLRKVSSCSLALVAEHCVTLLFVAR